MQAEIDCKHGLIARVVFVGSYANQIGLVVHVLVLEFFEKTMSSREHLGNKSKHKAPYYLLGYFTIYLIPT